MFPLNIFVFNLFVPDVVQAIHPSRTFLSPDTTLGFGFGDYVEFEVAVCLAVLVAAWGFLRRIENKLAGNAFGWFMFTAALPVCLRLLLLPKCPIPRPSGADDFSYVLLADTLRHLRLSMPAHALPRFFEQMFVLQQPTYSSMYAMGNGLALALGWLMFGHPWAGVLLSTAAFCGSCYWMLRGWISSNWALVGGLLVTFELGPLSYWTNSYWGGAVSATAGCLVFGALPRIRDYGRKRDAALLGCGLAIQLLTRPFEFFLLCLSVLVFFLLNGQASGAWSKQKHNLRLMATVSLFLLAAGSLMCVQNRQVTGSWTTLPYMLARYQYGIPSTFTFQPNPQPHRELNEEQEVGYRAQTIIHGIDTETMGSFMHRLLFRVRFVRFFVLPALYIALLAFAMKLRERRYLWVLLAIAIFALGSNFYPYFFPHYVAALASLFILVQVVGLEQLNRLQIAGRPLPIPLGSLLLLLSAAHFLFWFGVHAVGSERWLATAGSFETWDYINYGDPQGRIAIDQKLADLPGRKLVFIHYAPGHQFQEWVHNEADIDSSPVVTVHDLGPSENQQILDYYPHRTAWLLEPDQNPPRLTAYAPATTGFQDVR